MLEFVTPTNRIPMLRYLLTIALRATRMFRTVAAIMVPVMVLVYVAERLGLVQLAGRALAPAMAWMDLPAQAGIVWATTVLTNIYGGIAVIAALSDELHLNAAQMSALGAMMLFAHNLPTEQAVVRRAGASALFTGGLRLVVGARPTARAWPGSAAWAAGCKSRCRSPGCRAAAPPVPACPTCCPGWRPPRARCS